MSWDKFQIYHLS